MASYFHLKGKPVVVDDDFRPKMSYGMGLSVRGYVTPLLCSIALGKPCPTKEIKETNRPERKGHRTRTIGEACL
jgi:hypothetical protein